MLANQSASLQKSWNNTLDTFIKVASTFNYIVINAQRYKDVAGAIYIGFVNLNISNPMFNGTFYHDVNRDNLAAKQSIAVQFVQETNANWSSVLNTFRARVVFYQATNIEYNETTRLNDMFRTLIRTLTVGAAEKEVRSWARKKNNYVQRL